MRPPGGVNRHGHVPEGRGAARRGIAGVWWGQKPQSRAVGRTHCQAHNLDCSLNLIPACLEMSSTSENTGNFELCIQPELGGQKGDTSSRKPMCICRISGIYPRTRWGDAFPLRSKQFRRIPGSEARGEDHMGCIVPWSSIHTPREGKIKSSWPDLVSMARRWKPLKLRSP